MTPRTAAATSRGRELGRSLRRYAATVTAALGAAGLTLGSVLSGIGVRDWLERWGFWPTFALCVLAFLLAILTQMRLARAEERQAQADLQATAIAAIERRADQQLELLERREERREQRYQEMLELIMERHAAALGDVARSVEGLGERVEGLERRLGDAIGAQRRVSHG